VLIHLVDGTQDDVAGAWRTVRQELEAYGAGLEDKPEILALNKIDSLDADLRQLQKEALEEASGEPVRLVSGVSGQGVTELLRAAYQVVLAQRAAEKAEKDGGTPAAWTP
jgi:GTP-binding protein